MSLTKSKKIIDLNQVGVVGLMLGNVVVAGLVAWIFSWTASPAFKRQIER